ncbi:MAG: type II toxin-antitoxin system VapC family toxin [Phycisphaerales bacterium]
MNPVLVVDCSVTLAWCFDDEARSDCDHIQERLASEIAIVPILWKLEVANVLALAERKGRVAPERVAATFARLSDLLIIEDEDTSTHAWSSTIDLARKHKLTTYDAAYLELAIRKQIPLATLDVELQRAAAAATVPLILK